MQSSLNSGDLGHPGPAFEELKTFIVDMTGHIRLSARNDFLLEKVMRRLGSNGLSSIESYLELLKHDANGKTELDSLISELTIGETSFFRHPEQFDALRDHVLPACLRRNSGARQLRIWSAGCANGAETYSIAILVHALLADRLADWNVVIVGSDINRSLLVEAEKGLYTAWSLRDVGNEQRSAFFARQGLNWAIREKYKNSVHFVYHNLISGEFPCIHKNIFAFDIVMCRNVMIYFDEAKNAELAERLSSVLADDGWLFTGPTDFNPRLDGVFTLEKFSGALVYRKRCDRQAPPVPAPTPPAAAAKKEHRAELSWRRRRQPPQRAEARGADPQRRPQPAAPVQLTVDAIVELANKADWKAAAAYCEAFLQANSCDAWAHYYYALILQYSGSAVAAEQALKRAIYLDRNFALAHYQLGLLRKEARDLAQCSRSLRNALAALSPMPDHHPVSPCGQITALDLRELAAQQLELLDRP